LSHLVVTNDEGQHSTWPNDRPLPAGWHEEGFSGDEEQCLDYIGTVWTGLRPHSLRDLASSQPTVLAAEDVIVREMSADEVAALLDEKAVSPAWAPGYPLAGGRAAARNFGQRPAEERKPGFGPHHIVRLADGWWSVTSDSTPRPLTVRSKWDSASRSAPGATAMPRRR
jgi:uncharacterized protein YbdZ (MbtH family)